MNNFSEGQQIRTAYVVNLRGDIDRWANVLSATRELAWLHVERIEAVYGSSLPDDVCLRLTRDPYSIVNKGAVGCMLSHVRAWEKIIKGADPWALVFEDDAQIKTLERVREFRASEGLDLIFCNDRTTPEDMITGKGETTVKLGLSPIKNSLKIIDKQKKSVGTDGYLVSKHGAAKLVALFKSHGYFGHVDKRMLAYAVDASEVEELLSESSELRKEVISIKGATGPMRGLTAAVLSPPITFHHAGPETSRTREDRLGATGATHSQQ